MKAYLVLMCLLVQVAKPATLNDIQANVQSIAVQSVGNGNGNQYSCNNGYSEFQLTASSQLSKLYDGSVDIEKKTDECICGGSQSNSQELVMSLKKEIAAGTKTIIMTSTPDGTSGLTVKIAISQDGNTYTDVCSACVLGTNDFSTANSNTGLVAFKYLKVIWLKDQSLCLCEVWAYPYKNYVPSATTITGYGGNYQSQASVSYSDYKTKAVFMCLRSEESRGFYSGGSHTCIYSDGTDQWENSQLTYIVIDFPQPMVFKEFQVSSGPYETFIYIIDPISTLMQKTASQMVADMASVSNKDITKFVSYSSPTGEARLAYKQSKVSSQQCSDLACDEFAATRIVIANDFNEKDLFFCGFAIMAELLTCPPTTNQCEHATIVATTLPITTMTIPPLQTVTSSSFKFNNSLSVYCNDPSYCNLTPTFVLSCTDCSTCSSGPTTCGGTCSAPSPPPFTTAFSTVTDGFTISVTDNSSIKINHKCLVNATYNGKMVSSTNTISIKQVCGACNTTQYVATSVPNFAQDIAIGDKGMTAPFTAFTDTVTICGSTCSDSSYSVLCRLATNTTGAYTSIQSSWQWSGSISGSQSSFNFFVQSVAPSNHLKTYTCKLHGFQPDAQIEIDSASTFDVTFNLCSNASQSCPEDYWIASTNAWIQPTPFSVYLDGVAQSTSFIYTNWQDKWSTICGVGYCGTLNYVFIDTATNKTLNILNASSITTIDTVNQVVTLSISTTSNWSAGVYTVYAKGFLDNTGIWTGTSPYANSNNFNITIIDPCTLPNPCQYTKVLDSVQVFTTMTIYLNNDAVDQSYNLMNDYISNMCSAQSIVCGGKVYSLIDAATNTVIPSDLAVLKTNAMGDPIIQAATKNYLYTGTHSVKIKCTQLGTIGYSQPFNIIVVACDTRSCESTVLKAPVAPAALPSSYSIGVDNVAGQTTCALFTNTVGTACTANPLICGTITYQLIETSTGLQPSFTSISVGTQMIQSSQTSDISLNGPHVVKIMATLDLTALGLGFSALTANSSTYTITVDYCSPLPCNYNSLILPSSGLPADLYVYTNGTTATTTFPSYQDVVSQRCSSPYSRKCGAINYVVEDQSGATLPFTVSVVYNPVTDLCQISTSTTDSSLVNVYQLQIHASFASPPLSGTASDNTEAKFRLILDYPNQCMHLNCTKNQINMIRSGYAEPQNITIDVSMTWNQTVFDNYNDTKTSACWKMPGTDINNVDVTSWDRPVCGFPVYDVVDMSGSPITDAFGAPNVLVQYYQDTDFTQQFIVKARTNIKKLAGAHKVRLSVTLPATGVTQYSAPFFIIVVDPCNPYDCTITQFIPGLPNPSNINIAVGQGYVTSKQGLWSNTISNLCKQSTLLCGSPSFELLMEDLTPVPFLYLVNQNSQGISVNVIVTDETMKGQTYNVVLRGYGFDPFSLVNYGQNGTSLPFQVIVAEDSVINPNTVATQSSPIFKIFPPNLRFNTNEVTQYHHYTASVYSQNSTIAEIIVSLNNAILMVDYTLDGNNVEFDISLLNTTLPGTYKVDVKAIDLNGMFVSRTFTITAILVISEDVVLDNITVGNKKTPLTASITEITSFGLMTISYNRRVIPVTSIKQITQQDFYIYFEQLSFEREIFLNYTVVGMSPDQVFVQLNFSVPIDVSQGVLPDNVYVYMLDSVFMVEDFEGIYKSWQPGNQIYNTTLSSNRTKQRNYGVFTNRTVYYPLMSPVPKQLDDYTQIKYLESQINWLSITLKVTMWGSFGMHLIGFGSMEYVWLMFTNLQIISILSSLQLQMPLNLIKTVNSYSEIANSIFIPVSEVYDTLKYLASDAEDQTVNLYGQPYIRPQQNGTNYTDEDSRRLQSFEQSTFYSKGASDLVIVTSAQMIILIGSLTVLFLIGLVIKYTFYDYLPENVQSAFEYIRHRVFWNLPLRMLIQQYQCVTLAALLNIRSSQTGSIERTVNYICACVVLALYSIGFLVCATVFILNYRNRLQSWRQQCNSLFLSVATDRQWASISVTCNLLRKLLLVVVAVTIDIPTLQLYTATYIQLLYSCYVLLVKPMETKLRNFVELANELILLTIVTLMFTFTDYVPESSIKYYNGWIIIYMMMFQLSFNGFFLLADLLWHIKRMRKILRYKVYYMRMKRSVVKHNEIVDKLTHKGIKAENYKIKNPILQEQLDVIQSEGSLENQSSVQNLKKPEPMTIVQKKAEFEKRMKLWKITDRPDQVVDREWVVSAERKKRQEEHKEWEYVQNQSNASDWNALPAGYKNSQMIDSISLFSDEEAKQPIRSPVGMHNLLERSFEVADDH